MTDKHRPPKLDLRGSRPGSAANNNSSTATSPTRRTPTDIVNDIAIQCVSPLFPPYVDMSDALLVSKTIEAQQRRIIAAQRTGDPQSPAATTPTNIPANTNNNNNNNNNNSSSNNDSASDNSNSTNSINGIPQRSFSGSSVSTNPSIVIRTAATSPAVSQSALPNDKTADPSSPHRHHQKTIPTAPNAPGANNRLRHMATASADSVLRRVHSHHSSTSSSSSFKSTSAESANTSPDDVLSANALRTPRTLRREHKPTKITVYPASNAAISRSIYSAPMRVSGPRPEFDRELNDNDNHLTQKLSLNNLNNLASILPRVRPRDSDDEEDEDEDPEDRALSEHEKDDDVEQTAISPEDEMVHTQRKKRKVVRPPTTTSNSSSSSTSASASSASANLAKKERFLMLCAEMWDLFHD